MILGAEWVVNKCSKVHQSILYTIYILYVAFCMHEGPCSLINYIP